MCSINWNKTIFVQIILKNRKILKNNTKAPESLETTLGCTYTGVISNVVSTLLFVLKQRIIRKQHSVTSTNKKILVKRAS